MDGLRAALLRAAESGKFTVERGARTEAPYTWACMFEFTDSERRHGFDGDENLVVDGLAGVILINANGFYEPMRLFTEVGALHAAWLEVTTEINRMTPTPKPKRGRR